MATMRLKMSCLVDQSNIQRVGGLLGFNAQHSMWFPKSIRSDLGAVGNKPGAPPGAIKKGSYLLKD